MNAFPNQVERSSAPFPSSMMGEMNQRTISNSNFPLPGSVNQQSHGDSGDLQKFSGSLVPSQCGSVIHKEKLSAGKIKAHIKVRKSHNPSRVTSGSVKPQARKKWKKPKDKPNRPLSAYNLFFQSERVTMLGEGAKASEQEKGLKRVHRKTHGKIGFAEMARIIGQRWKDLPEYEKKPFMDQATKEKERYVVELEAWNVEQARTRPAKSLVASLIAEVTEHDTSESHDLEAPGKKKTERNMGKERREALETSTSGLHLRQMAMLKQQQKQQIQEDYVRLLQQRRMALLAGRVGMDSFMFQQYPSAAEASANALLSQYQPNTLAGMNSMGLMMGPMGLNNIGMNTISMNNMGMNAASMNNVGINHMSMNNMGINNMRMNNVGMNIGMGMSTLAASLNMMSPSDLQQLGSSRLQQQLRTGIGGHGRNEPHLSQD